MTLPKTAPGQPALRLAATLALWLLAATPFAVLALGHADPRGTGAVVDAALAILARAALGFAAVGAVLLLAWPPALPRLRVAWQRFRDRLRVDQRPLLEALGRLEHFESAPDHLRAGRVLQSLGQPARAVQHLAAAVRLEPDQPGSLFALARALVAVGALPDAARVLERTVAIEPDHAYGDALLELARVRRKLGDDAGALAALSERERRIGSERRGDLLRGELLRAGGDLAGARAAFERAAVPHAAARKPTPEEALVRAEARVALWRLPRSAGGER